MKNNTTIQGALDPSKYVINLIRVSINDIFQNPKSP